jgi:Flp pilus assembly protein TadD
MTKSLGVLLCAALSLGGCAQTVDMRPLFSTAPRAASPAPALDPDQGNTLYLGIIDGLIKQGRQNAALAFLDGYRQRGETLPAQYWLLRGNALLALGRDEDAGDAFEKLQNTPLAAYGWNGLGRIAAAERNWTVAALEFREAVNGEPANAQFLNNLAFADLNLGQSRSATARLEQAHELDPESERIRTNLIIALRMSGDEKRADLMIDGIKDIAQRDSIRTLVQTAIATLTTEQKS